MKRKANYILNFPRNILIEDCGRIKADRLRDLSLNEKIPLSENKEKTKPHLTYERAEAKLTHTFLLSASVSVLELQWELWTISEHEPCCEHTDRKVGKRLVFIHIISFCFLCTRLHNIVRVCLD